MKTLDLHLHVSPPQIRAIARVLHADSLGLPFRPVDADTRDSLLTLIVGKTAITHGIFTPEIQAVVTTAHRQFIGSRRKTKASIERIIQAVARHYDFTPSAITGKRRTFALVTARQVAIHLCRKLAKHGDTNLGQIELGKYFRRDHSVICWSLQSIQNRLDTEPALRQTVAHLESQVGPVSPSGPSPRL